jgi:hypothetical protein
MNRHERRKAAAKAPGKRGGRCPGCGVWIVLDAAAHEIRHPNPICKGFEAFAARFNLTAKHVEPWVEVIDPVTGRVLERGKA